MAERASSTKARSPASSPILLGVALWGCAHTAHTVAPYRDDAHAGQELVDRARSCCLERTGQLPPQPFVTDGCSAFADEVDRRLEQCVADLGHPFLARVMYRGVRAGGVSWIPLHSRWGFGWKFPYDGDPGTAPQPRGTPPASSAAEAPR